MAPLLPRIGRPFPGLPVFVGARSASPTDRVFTTADATWNLACAGCCGGGFDDTCSPVLRWPRVLTCVFEFGDYASWTTTATWNGVLTDPIVWNIDGLPHTLTDCDGGADGGKIVILDPISISHRCGDVFMTSAMGFTCPFATTGSFAVNWATQNPLSIVFPLIDGSDPTTTCAAPCLVCTGPVTITKTFTLTVTGVAV